MVDDLPPSHTNDPEALGLQLGVAQSVALEGGSRRVEGEAVYLHDQAFLAPKEVDLVPGEAHVHIGRRELRLSNQGKESFFGLGACEDRGAAAIEKSSKGRGAATAGVTGE